MTQKICRRSDGTAWRVTHARPSDGLASIGSKIVKGYQSHPDLGGVRVSGLAVESDLAWGALS
jgi:hypothetical protein